MTPDSGYATMKLYSMRNVLQVLFLEIFVLLAKFALN